MFRIALALSAAVVIACIVWSRRMTSGNGPDFSVDFRPLVPIVVGTGLLLLIWVTAIGAWIIKHLRRDVR